MVDYAALIHPTGYTPRARSARRIDRAADRVANDAARPGIQDCCQIDEARRDGDVSDIRHPELVRAIDNLVPGEVREDRVVVIAISRGHKPPAALSTTLN